MNNYSNAAVENNNRKDGKSATKISLPYAWKPTLYMPWKKEKMSKELVSDNLKMGRLLSGEIPTPEEITLTTGAVKKKRKAFEVFRKYILRYT